MEELYDDGYLSKSDETGKRKARKGQRKSVDNAQEFNANIDIEEERDTRFVQLARPCDITMAEPEPMIWQRPDIFFDDVNQEPVDLTKQGFINWNDLRSSGSSKESIQESKSSSQVSVPKANDNLQGQAVEPQILDEFPPLPPPDAVVNLDNETFRGGSIADLTAGQDGNVEKRQTPPVVSTRQNGQENAAKRPRLDAGDRRDEEVNERDGVLKLSLELSPLHEELDDQRAQRRKRNFRPVDAEETMISYETMKRNQLDYSSLLKTKEELRSGTMAMISKYPTLHELLLPYPAYAGNRFPKECIELYKSRVCDTMTYEQALTEDPRTAPDRGSPSKLWRYQSEESSSKSSKSDSGHIDIAFLNETPLRFLNEREKESRLPSERDGLKTPSKMFLKETPEWYRPSDERLSEISMRINNGPLQMAADIPIEESIHPRESRGSYAEEARRLTTGTNEFDRRPSSVQLFEPFRPSDVSEQSLQSGSGRFSLPDSLKEKFQTEEGRCLLEALSSSRGFIALSSIIPTASTSRKRAARVFSALLNLLAYSIVTVEQDAPFAEIWMQACPVSRSSDEGAQDMVTA
ncbi:hypothetical protein GCK32_006827 [Trichostrongylus colubriformis]|uniref:Rad21/Rec8-like protein C-terminal eukaryotic domain-containing protein n=1 Tax=Trichostrongylus colubriformis TaxID=6319 RepID=A0AAN8G515_TRICO